jgi:Flp pilus assembly protein TadB
VVLVLLAAVDRSAVAPLITTAGGWLCLVSAIALDALGLVWMRRMVGAVR